MELLNLCFQAPDNVPSCKSNFPVLGMNAYLLTAHLQALVNAHLTANEVLGVEMFGGTSRIPALRKVVQDVFGMEPGQMLNAKDSVAQGCSLMCAILNRDEW